MGGVWYCKNRYVYDWSELKLYVCDLCTTLDATDEIKCGETGHFVFCVIYLFSLLKFGTDTAACNKVDWTKNVDE